MAAGGRPRQHDARPRGAHRPRAGLPAGAAVLHRGRDRRGVRRRRAGSPARPSCAPRSKRDGRDLLAQFRALAPPRRPISLQRWSFRRVASRSGWRSSPRCSSVSQTWQLFSPTHDLGIYEDTRTAGPSNTMILMAQSVPDGDVRAVPRLPSRRMGPRRCLDQPRRGVVLAVSDLAGEPCGRGDVAPRRTRAASRAPPRCRATRSGRAASSDRRRCHPDSRRRAPTCSRAGASPTSSRSTTTRRPTCSSTSTARWRSSPATSSSSEVDDADGLRLCGAGAPECPGGDPDGRLHRRRLLDARHARHRGGGDDGVPAPPRCRTRVGEGARRGRRRAGSSAASSLSACRTGTGAPTASSSTRSRSPSRRRWRSPSCSTSSPAPARWPPASRPGSSSRRGRCGRSAGASACFRRYRELLALLRREGFRAGARLTGDEAAGARLRTVLEEAGGVYVKLGQIAATRVDLVPPDVADALTQLQNQVAPEPARRSGRCSRPSSARRSTRCSPSSTGSRSPPRRSARPTSPGCAPASRSS